MHRTPTGPLRGVCTKLRAAARKRLGVVPFLAAGALVAFALKRFNGAAGAEDLDWVLAPTCRLAGILAGIPFVREEGAGWISLSHRIIVGPSCAGLNFLTIAFSTCFLPFVGRLTGPAARAAWLPVSLGLAWVLTVTTNAVRIIAAIHLHGMDIYGGLVTRERVHLAEGALVYCVALLMTYHALEAAFHRLGPGESPRRIPSALVPLGLYLVFVLGVPLLNRAHERDAGRFWGGALLVLGVCLSLAMASLLLRSACRTIVRVPANHRRASRRIPRRSERQAARPEAHRLVPACEPPITQGPARI